MSKEGRMAEWLSREVGYMEGQTGGRRISGQTDGGFCSWPFQGHKALHSVMVGLVVDTLVLQPCYE